MNEKAQQKNNLSTLKTKLTLHPGQPGTKQLKAQYSRSPAVCLLPNGGIPKPVCL
ncbi:MAG: hypothetical protein GY801_28990 [bacterium]|nr:hypothetical protein [bacterium]